MNRELWNSFIEQIDAQVDGDFLSLAKEYESVTGHPFKVKSYSGNRLLFSMLEQVMQTQHKELLTHAITFISQLPPDLQRKYQVFSRRRVSSHSVSEESTVDITQTREKPMVTKLLNILHRTA